LNLAEVCADLDLRELIGRLLALLEEARINAAAGT
jgi:hypothetical protein